jgi:transcriptional regulator with XRE-family HTH domain
MKDRIVQLRKSLGLTQAEFGSRIDLTDAMISRLESGNKLPQEGTIRLICYTFGVREDWLRYGKGEMREQSLEANSEEGRLLEMFRKLSPGMQDVVLQKIREMLAVDSTPWAYPDIPNEQAGEKSSHPIHEQERT